MPITPSTRGHVGRQRVEDARDHVVGPDALRLGLVEMVRCRKAGSAISRMSPAATLVRLSSAFAPAARTRVWAADRRERK